MAVLKGKALAGALAETDFKSLGFDSAKEFELQKIKNGVWVLTELEQQKPPLQIDETEQKIIGLLKKKELKERVEGVFEKLLGKQELEKFVLMLKQGKIIRFKLNKEYKKAVYKLPEDATKQPAKPVVKELVDKQNIEEYDLRKNGFLVVRNEERAKRISEELSGRIKKGEVKGTKSFDGNFYIIEAELLEQLKQKAAKVLAEKKSATTEEIAKALNIGTTPVKIACEFLKEEGSVFEKKKGVLCYIE